ncbi:MAG: hypothetical protein ACQEWV_26060 [Bacillota bacterium]
MPDPNDEKAKVKPERVHNGTNCPQISMYSVEGPLFFGAAPEFETQVLDSLSSDPKVLSYVWAKYRSWTRRVNIT